jgi:uncharacterized protein (DUF427 family)
VGDKSADNVAWSYEQPQDAVAGIREFIAFYADRLDAWYEDEPG